MKAKEEKRQNEEFYYDEEEQFDPNEYGHEHDSHTYTDIMDQDDHKQFNFNQLQMLEQLQNNPDQLKAVLEQAV